MHRVRASQGLPQDGAVDTEPFACGATHLRIAGLSQNDGRAEQRVRQATHQRNLGAEAINPALIAAAVSCVLVGAGIEVSRLALAEIPPLTLAMLRYAIGFACLAPFAWQTRLRCGQCSGNAANARNTTDA